MSDHQRLLDTIHYDPATGIAVYRRTSGTVPAGSRVGSICYGTKRSKPYRYMKMCWLFEGSKPFTHIVHFYMTGRWPVAEMDHIHGDTLDDRWSEIRESTRSQNEANRGARRNNSTGYKGVVPQPSGRFVASFWRRGMHVHIGTFDTPELAHAAYLAAVEGYDGEFLRAA